jgi:hypothetical protein
MTTKQEVNLNTYKKDPRELQKSMMEALKPTGGLNPILAAVINDNENRFRLDIRYHSFNVYYKGGNLLCVDGNVSPWSFAFDEKYFKDGPLKLPILPEKYSSSEDSIAWVDSFSNLVDGMEYWWKQYSKGERAQCQAIASSNSAKCSLPMGDYLVLDLEYQWAQRRFDMIATKRRPTSADSSGWIEPDLVFVEVKSLPSACSGKSGLGDHARDYQDMVMACGGRRIQEFKQEFEKVNAQKISLGLIDKSFPFNRFSEAIPELLIVFIDLDMNTPSLQASLKEVKKVSDELGNNGRIRFMQLHSKSLLMRNEAAVASE